jgi:hypothetical protein
LSCTCWSSSSLFLVLAGCRELGSKVLLLFARRGGGGDRSEGMSSAQIAPADHVCYVHCSFCNTVLAVCKLIYLYVSLCCLLRIDDLSLYHFLSLSLPLYLMISDCLRENHPSSSSVHHHTIGMFHLHDLLATLFQLLFLLAALVEA